MDRNGLDGDGFGVFAQQLDANGSPIETEFQVNVHTSDNQGECTVAMSAAGQFVVVWTSYPGQDGDGHGRFPRCYRRRESVADRPG